VRETAIEKIRLGRTDLAVTKMGWDGIPIQRVQESDRSKKTLRDRRELNANT
jgi:hypothetical protein